MFSNSKYLILVAVFIFYRLAVRDELGTSPLEFVVRVPKARSLEMHIEFTIGCCDDDGLWLVDSEKCVV